MRVACAVLLLLCLAIPVFAEENASIGSREFETERKLREWVSSQWSDATYLVFKHKGAQFLSVTLRPYGNSISEVLLFKWHQGRWVEILNLVGLDFRVAVKFEEGRFRVWKLTPSYTKAPPISTLYAEYYLDVLADSENQLKKP